MNRFQLACVIGSVALGAMAVAADPLIDLKGKVAAAADGIGLGNARVTLLAAGISDTTDATGAFRIVGDPAAIFRPDRGGNLGPLAGRSFEIFDVSGRLVAGSGDGPLLKIVRTGRFNEVSLYAGLPSGGAGGDARDATRGGSLAKTGAAIDTLLVTRSGFSAVKVPVSSYKMEFETIRLQPETGGFEIRKPVEQSFTCGSSTSTALGMDMVCESENDSLRASVYVQSRPVSCGPMAAIHYAVEKAWIRTAGGIQPLTQAVYDGGGNHMNDRITFLWNGKFYSFYHSSFGFGWRACAPPDCMQICQDKDCSTVLHDSCNRETCAATPTLKVRCVVVKRDGTVPELLDPWTKQAGDADYPLLPCYGDAICR